MADLKTQFEQAAQDSQNLPSRPDNNTMLQLYSLYKQATVGDVNTKRPGMTDFIGRAKWDAWEKLKGTTQDQAMEQYVALVNQLKRAESEDTEFLGTQHSRVLAQIAPRAFIARYRSMTATLSSSAGASRVMTPWLRRRSSVSRRSANSCSAMVRW